MKQHKTKDGQFKNDWDSTKIKKIYNMCKKYNYREIGQEFGVTNSAIGQALRRNGFYGAWALKYKNTKNLSKTDGAYIAGILDGEGHIKNNGRRIEVVNTDKFLIDWLQSKIGGSVYKVKKTKPHYKQAYKLYIPQRRARFLLKAIFPYLIVKKDSARKFMIEHRETH